MNDRKYALLAVGELLADFIGTEITENIGTTNIFERFQGGSPANLAYNMSRLGAKTAVVSCVGNDNLGKFLVSEVSKSGLETRHIIFSDEVPSSLVLVSRTTGTPDFIPYRMADRMLYPHHIPDELLSQSAIFHTTCWPLSMQPSQNTVLDAAARAKKAGCLLSADLNYAEKVWPDRAEAHKVIKQYLSYGAIIKLSEDDAERFYGEKVSTDRIFEDFHDWGATLVCLTLGSKGSLVSASGGEAPVRTPAKPLQVVDATGAGDSYWSGFLMAYIDHQNLETCAVAGANMAAIKLCTLGPVKDAVDKKLLYVK